MKNVFLLLGILACTVQVTAQANVKQVGDLLGHTSFAEEGKPWKGIISIDSQLGLTADQFISGKKQELCEDQNSGLVKIGSQQSKAGREHHRYQQTWGGVPIEGQFLLAHESNGKLSAVNGALLTSLSIITSPTLTEQAALGLVLLPHLKQYAWDNPVMEADLQATKNDPMATWFPKGKLVIVPGDHSPTPSPNDFRLAWRFNVYSIEPHAHDAIYVDAQTGEIIKKRSLMRHSYENGTGITNYNGTKNIVCNKHGNHYELKNEVVETRKFNGWFYGYGNSINNFTPNWINKKDAIDVHWGIEQFVDYLNTNLDRDGYNDNGGHLTAMTNLDQNNAFWDGTRMWFGKGDNIDRSSLTSLDIVAHEYTHAMLDQIIPGGFTYAGESGAIEESYCDIFGELLELYSKGNADWKVGAEVTMTNGNSDGTGLRNLSTPRQYKDNLWHDGPSDNWGVHSNSALHNYWFYLLTHGNGSTINGIGIPAATELLYETLFMLQPYSDYIMLRNSSISTSLSLPSFTQAMKDDVEAAWTEVGLNIQAAAEITNVQPSYGAEIYGGFVDTISWDTNLSIATVDLEYSINGGVSWTTIATAINYVTGFYAWKVPQHFSSTALVKVVDANNLATRGVSEGYFNLINTRNIAPIANDDVVNTTQGFFEIIKPWKNDFDEELDTNSIGLVTDIWPSEGTLLVQGSNSIRISVVNDFIGTFSFSYHVCDDGTPVLCDTAMITVNVEKAPAPQWAMDNWEVQSLGETTIGNLMADNYNTDSTWIFDGWDVLTLSHGSLNIDDMTGDFSYTADSFGRDTILYFISNQDNSVLDTGYLNLFNINGGGLEKDSMYLIMLYEMTDGVNWIDSWDISTPVSNWYGTQLTIDRVQVLNLYDNQLTGIIPKLRLPNLSYINLSNNQLSGSIPNFNLPNLIAVNLDENNLSGSIPNFNLPELTNLNLGNNQLFGAIPNLNLPKLRSLYFRKNQLSGSIPDFNFPELIYLYFHTNQLSGNVPNFNFPNLKKLSLSINHLSGNIPNFNLPNLEGLGLGNNQLSGNIPNFDFPNLTELLLHTNNLSGNIPNFNFPNLTTLFLSGNQLSGSIPNFNFPNLTDLYLGENQLTGSIPNFDFPNLVQLSLNDNQLSGSLPNFNFPNLTNFILYNNQLTFEGIEHNLWVGGFHYSPQKRIPIHQTSDTLSVFAGDTLSDNTYTWFHESSPSPIATYTGKDYFLPMKEGNIPMGEGNYYCKITNTDVTNPNDPHQNLILTSNTLYFTPTCYSSSNLPSTITICPLDSIDAGYSKMQSYTWLLNDSIVGTEQKLSISAAGTYTLQMQDACSNPIVNDSIEVMLDPDCIYPGDTNHDGLVNHFDLLEIGLYFGANGSPRSDTSTSFAPIMGNDWATFTKEGSNLKHIDCNGDGNINALDTMAINRNYGNTWKNHISAYTEQLSPLRLIPEIYAAPSGTSDTIFIRYILENDLDSLIQYYGFACTSLINAPIPYEGIVNLDAVDAANTGQYLVISEQVDTNKIETTISKSDLQDEVIGASAVVVGGSQITTERDLPGGDSLSIIEISTTNVRLTTVNNNFALGSFAAPISGGKTSLYYTENLAYTLNPAPASCEAYGQISTRIVRGTAPYNFLWSNGQTTAIATGLAIGTYQVSITDSAGKTIVGQSTVGGIDKIGVAYSIIDHTKENSNGTISLQPSGGLGNYSIYWNDANAQTGPIATGLRAGTYVAIVEDEACAESFSFEIGDTESAANEISSINVSPNPIRDKAIIHFNLTKSAYLNIRIIDMLGKTVNSEWLEAQGGLNESILDTNALAPGVYFVAVGNQKEMKTTVKFVKIK